jgi:hypothetical protein
MNWPTLAPAEGRSIKPPGNDDPEGVRLVSRNAEAGPLAFAERWPSAGALRAPSAVPRSHSGSHIAEGAG